MPPGIYDGRIAAANLLAVPHPGFGIDGFAHRAEQAQAGQVKLLHVLIAPLHKGANRGGRGVKNADLVLFDQFPKASGMRMVRHAFVHHLGDAVKHRTIDDVRVSGNPAYVGGTPEHVVVFHIKNILVGEVGIGLVAAYGMQHTLGFARRAGGIENKERMLGVQFFCRAVLRCVRHQLVIPVVASVFHGDVVFTALHHKNAFHTRTLLQSLVHCRFKRQNAAAPIATVSGNDCLGFAVYDAVC